MDKKLQLVVTSPERLALDKQVDFVAMPAFGGELGVLPGHAPCLVQLKEGILHYKSGTETGAFAVMGGFAEIYKNTVAVFAEAAELAAEIDEERARQALAKSKNILAAKGGDMDIETVQASLRRAVVRIKLAKKTRNL